MSEKRKASDSFPSPTSTPSSNGAAGAGGALVVKRSRTEDSALSRTSYQSSSSSSSSALIKVIPRTSSLQSPIMQLSGHQAEILSCKFSSDGKYLATGSFDKEVYLWEVYGECKNVNVLKGHKGAVVEVAWSRDNSMIFTASSDKCLGIFDASTGERIKKYKAHTNVVNSLSPARRGTELIATGSDDGKVKLWDLRSKHSVQTFDAKWAVTAVAFSADAAQLFVGGIDNVIQSWDLRKGAPLPSPFKSHTDTITGLRVSHDGSYLLSNAMDSTVKIWDLRPFVPVGSSRLLKTLEGAPHGFEKNLIRPAWSPDGDFVVSGSGDRSVVVWDTLSGKIVYKLPGHKGVVNEVDWHPREPIIASCSSDKTVFLGEVNPEEVK